ncbi:hypothetical protein BROSI_A0691 [Candidatus Brocadia sinica JPN1]|uniref:Uncharacterized protein n=1 Tax=Candidatus Brocadia sinica JPN1 TaxID=1197129 RepID=A0ABQ0JTW1_9BACT|nr:hypothetical protein BROSI_A0691 [Candidatus Brocadia sinica JPN1]
MTIDLKKEKDYLGIIDTRQVTKRLVDDERYQIPLILV